MGKNSYLPVGRIVGAHGIKGAIRATSYAESLSVFNPGNRIMVKNPGAPAKTCEIEWVKSHPRGILLSLKNVNTRDQAESFIGADLLIEKGALPDLEEGLFYWFDIIGLSVFTIDERYLGRIESIIPTGSNDVYVVKDPNKKEDSETLIPALVSVVLKIDTKKKTLIVDLPKGLL